MAAQQQRMDVEDAAEELQAIHDEPALMAFEVEDEPIVRQMVATVLKRAGWSLFEAEDGSIALSVAPATPYERLIAESPRKITLTDRQIAPARPARRVARSAELSARH